MGYLNTPAKADLIEDCMNRLKEIADANHGDGQRLATIRGALQKLTIRELNALWWMFDADHRRP